MWSIEAGFIAFSILWTYSYSGYSSISSAKLLALFLLISEILAFASDRKELSWLLLVSSHLCLLLELMIVGYWLARVWVEMNEMQNTSLLWKELKIDFRIINNSEMIQKFQIQKQFLKFQKSHCLGIGKNRSKTSLMIKIISLINR